MRKVCFYTLAAALFALACWQDAHLDRPAVQTAFLDLFWWMREAMEGWGDGPDLPWEWL